MESKKPVNSIFASALRKNVESSGVDGGGGGEHTHTEGETKNNGRQRNHLTTTKVCFLTFEDPIKCNDVNLKHFPGEA